MFLPNRLYRFLYAGIALALMGILLSCQTSKEKTPKDTRPEGVIERPNTDIPPVKPADKPGDLLLENSRGYRAERSESLKERPDWVRDGKTPEEEQAQGTYYFQAVAEGITIPEASEEAENRVKQEIASYILVEREQMDVQIGSDGKGGRSGKKPVSPAAKEEMAEQEYINAWVQSGSSFSGGQREEYWELTKNGETKRIQYWVRYTITEEEIASAGNQIKSQGNIQKKEQEDFKKLQTRLGRVLPSLDKTSFIEQEDSYRKDYEELLGIYGQWKELITLKEQSEYIHKTKEILAAIEYYDPTDRQRQIRQERERLKIEGDLLKNENEIGRARGASPARGFTPLSLGAVRIQVSKMISNGEFLAFLDETDSPDFASRRNQPQKTAVQVSWLEAVRYCNWLSERSGLESYYSINGDRVSLSRTRNGKNGYRLPSKEEISAGLDAKVIRQEELRTLGILSADTNRAYCFDTKTQGLRALDGAFPTSNIGFVVVRND